MSIYKSTLSYIHLLLLKQTHTLFDTHTPSFCGLWLSQLSGGVLWSIGVGGFCFLLLCQVPSQRLLISVNLSCATTFSLPHPLSLPYLFDFSSFSLHIFISLSSPYLTYSHCVYCPMLFPRAAADHPAVTPVVSSIVLFASHSRISESHLSYRRRSCLQHRTHTVKAVCHIDNKQVCFYSTLMAMSVETFQQRFQS